MNARWVVAVALAVTSGGVRAETAAGPETIQAAAAAPAPAPSEPAKHEPQSLVENVPDSEKAARTQEHIARMKEILGKVIKHLEEARDEKDVVKLNCVNEKLTNVKGLLKISEDGDVKMQEALARRNVEEALHEYEKISIARTKCEQLFAESEACVGELAVYAGDTQVEVVVEGEPPTDMTENVPKISVITRPPAASPYQ
ncbi:MAG: hypothetical protein HY903_01575 [Deltaproteobacteria bacterium]|nr:hypothetical protein [Deltaproteobacteria bacterium]